jgi:hypothetical protein
VSDDGRYSPPFICAGSRVGGGYAVEEQDLRGVVATDRVGHILHEFGKGHRVNLVLLLKVVPDLTLPLVGCGPLGTDVPGLNNSNNPTEGTVFPDNADQRVDLPLNWFIQP